MAVGALRRLAAAAPAPVFVVPGAGRLEAVEDLSLNRALRFVPSPRHAAILLTAGAAREADRPALRRLHDQIPPPRATLWWGAPADPGTGVARFAAGEEDPAPALRALWQELLSRGGGEPDLLPDAPPAPWQGLGDYGQGGEGMMGGVPYGRPMAMTADDPNDGLALDGYSAPVGPFLPGLPPGLTLDLTFQGDMIAKAEILRPPLAQPAGHPLRRISRLLRVLGLPGPARRFLRAAQGAEAGRPPPLPALGRLLRWSGAVRAIPPGLGAAGGADLRTRLLLWWREAARGEPSPAPDLPPLPELLPGLEWSEAVLVLNSLDIPRLRRLCEAPAEEAA